MPNELYKWFEREGTKVVDFADLVGVHRNLVYLWLSGKRHPNLKNALKIHRYTGIDLDDLLEKKS